MGVLKIFTYMIKCDYYNINLKELYKTYLKYWMEAYAKTSFFQYLEKYTKVYPVSAAL